MTALVPSQKPGSVRIDFLNGNSAASLLNKETNNSSLHAECFVTRRVLGNPGRDAKTIELDEGKSKQIALP